MALYYSKGRISDMSAVQSGTSKNGYQWQRMTIILEITGFQGAVYRQVFQVSGDSVQDVLHYKIGDKVDIAWSMYAREWKGKWFNNVELVKIKDMEDGKPVPASQPKAVDQEPVLDGTPVDDLPF